MKVQPYPLNYPRSFDLLPLLSFQQAVDPDLEFYLLSGYVSVPMEGFKEVSSIKKKTLKFKEYNTTLTRGKIARDTTDVFSVSSSLSKPLGTQKDYWDFLLEKTGAEIPECVIHSRGILIDTPKELRKETGYFDFSSFSRLSFLQTKVTSSKRTVNRFGLKGIVKRPYSLIKNECLSQKCWFPRFSKRLRSILKTQSILAIDGHKGWTELFAKTDKKYKFPPLSSKVNYSLTKNRWWQDMGIPIKLLGTIDSINIEAILYHLLKFDAKIIG